MRVRIMDPKITIIGAGSLVFTPHILADIAMSDDLRGSNVHLMDVDEERLNLMAKLSDRIIKERKADMTVDYSTERAEALRKCWTIW
jgi:alpha-galactosidase